MSWFIAIPSNSKLYVMHKKLHGLKLMFEFKFPSYIIVNEDETIDTDVVPRLVLPDLNTNLETNLNFHTVPDGYRYGVYTAVNENRLEYLEPMKWNTVHAIDYNGSMPLMLNVKNYNII